ncbi:MAG TPA: UrcA family protein [Phenylobacterium sp.]|uniref:UrcA family protein n=1 Tax=Phenylobacterium sp. TaxID=1871053 RepID=UPI002C1B1C76|nr:UrcA family protein [Phenylobacterium sp.]HSV03007.1 UrcA family protein [Phenylobacterium sp.]
MNRYSFTAAVAALSLASGAAFAQTADQMVVKLGDLNLGTPQGSAVALKRIDNAATQFCGGDLSRDIGRRLEQQKCASQMTAQAVTKLNVLQASTGAHPSIIVASRTAR